MLVNIPMKQRSADKIKRADKDVSVLQDKRDRFYGWAGRKHNDAVCREV